MAVDLSPSSPISGAEPVQPSAEAPRPRHALARSESFSRLRNIRLEVWFAVIGLVFGLALVFFIPPGAGLDEPNHFARVVTIAQGDLLASTRGPGQKVDDIGGGPEIVGQGLHRAGGAVPACVEEYLHVLRAEAAKPLPYSPGQFWRTPNGCQHRPDRFVVFENTAVNSPLSYAPEVVGVAVLRGVGAPLPVVFFGGRLAGLLVYLALVYLSLRVAPRGKAVLFLVGATPMALAQASAYSADGMTIALALLSVALALRCSLDPRATWWWFGALAASLVALGLSKNTYFVLAPLVLVVPAARLAVRDGTAGIGALVRPAWWAKGGTVVAALVASGAWYLLVRHVSLAAYHPAGGTIDAHLQAQYLLHHPIAYLKVLGRSLFDSSSQQIDVPGYVLAFGVGRPASSGSGPAIGAVAFAGILMGLAYRAEVGAPRPVSERGQSVVAWLPVALAIVSVLLIFTVLWVSWTPVGSLTVFGIQGRYFLPIVAVPVVTVALLWTEPEGRRRYGWFALGAVYLLVYALAKILFYYYH